MEARSSRASHAQLGILIEFMERNGDLARPQPGAQGRLRAENLWNELMGMLNAVGGGVYKELEKWKKGWADWKTKTKTKVLKIRNHARGTGGGPSCTLSLTDYEVRVLGIMGLLALTGQEDVVERGINIPNQSEPNPPNVENPGAIEIGESSQIQLADVSSPIPSPPQPQPSPPPPSVMVESSSAHPRSPGEYRRQAEPSTPSRALPSSQQRRRRRILTPFERASNDFAAIEQRRLQLEELREQNLHARETERLRLESHRIEVQRETIRVLQSLANIAQTYLERIT